MDALALATRGFITTEVILALIDLIPDPIILRGTNQAQAWVVLNEIVHVDTDVDLSSDDPTIVTVPSTVTVLDGDQIAEFTVSAVAPGATQIRATFDGVEVTASVTVIDAELRPQIHDAVNLKPKVTSAQNLRPKIYDTEES